MKHDFHNGRILLYHDDCRKALKELPDNSIDSIVCDPPYHLTSIVKRFGKQNSAPAKFGTDGAFSRASRGFMNQLWDGGDIAFSVELWQEAYRVLKPGGHLAAFSGSRTYHRMACAIEDAGFEIRDQIMWVYGTGFPKSHDVSKGIDKRRATNDKIRPWLKGLGSREEIAKAANVTPRQVDHWLGDNNSPCPQTLTYKRFVLICDHFGHTPDWADEMFPEKGDFLGNVVHARSGGKDFAKIPGAKSTSKVEERFSNGTDEAKQWEGWGSSLKPSHEPICLARKPLEESSIAANVLKYGTGAINIDASRVHAEDAKGGSYTVKRLKPGATLNKTGGNWRPEEGGEYHGEMKPGRWPANLCHDGSEEVVKCFPHGKSGVPGVRRKDHETHSMSGRLAKTGKQEVGYADEGSAARFFNSFELTEAEKIFYSGKANKTDRNGSSHPTVKPIKLMEWLVRMVTPPGGTVLDMFAGSGTTGKAAFDCGFNAVLIEREDEYVQDIIRRFSAPSLEDFYCA